MSEYRLNDPRQGLIGPVRIETVRDLVSAGVVQDDVLVSCDGGPWLPLASCVEAFGQPQAAGSHKATHVGDLSKNSFFRVFFRFHLAEATGLLTVKDHPRQKDIYLEQGNPVFISSNVETERLGEVLLRHGAIDPYKLMVALHANTPEPLLFGQILLRLGFIAQDTLVQGLLDQQLERLVDLCHWRCGQYVLFENARYLGEKLDLRLSPNDLVLAATRTLDNATLETNLQPHVDAVVTRVTHKELDEGFLPLTEAERRVLDLVDGRRTVAEIIAACDGEESRCAARVLISLLLEIDAAVLSVSPVKPAVI